jgi:hypothetical protein
MQRLVLKKRCVCGNMRHCCAYKPCAVLHMSQRMRSRSVDSKAKCYISVVTLKKAIQFDRAAPSPRVAINCRSSAVIEARALFSCAIHASRLSASSAASCRVLTWPRAFAGNLIVSGYLPLLAPLATAASAPHKLICSLHALLAFSLVILKPPFSTSSTLPRSS